MDPGVPEVPPLWGHYYWGCCVVLLERPSPRGHCCGVGSGGEPIPMEVLLLLLLFCQWWGAYPHRGAAAARAAVVLVVA